MEESSETIIDNITQDIHHIPSYLLLLPFGTTLQSNIINALTSQSSSSSPSSLSSISQLIKKRELFINRLATFGILGKKPYQFTTPHNNTTTSIINNNLDDDESSYTDELLEIFRSRAVPISLPSGNHDQQSSSSFEDDNNNNNNNPGIIPNSDTLIDRTPIRTVSEQLVAEFNSSLNDIDITMGGVGGETGNEQQQQQDDDDYYHYHTKSNNIKTNNKNTIGFNKFDDEFQFPLPSSWQILVSSSFKPQRHPLLLTTIRNADDPTLSQQQQSRPTTSTSSSHKPSLAWSNRAVPEQCTIYYFEIEILDGLQSSDVSLGFLYDSQDKYLHQMPGLDVRSFGFNGHDGKIYCKSENVNEYFGLKFGIHDIIGCGLNRYTGTIFYTKNGILLGDLFDNVIRNKLIWPCIGMGEYISVKTNFGLRNEDGNFLFDINNYVKKFQNLIYKEIENSTLMVVETNLSSSSSKLSSSSSKLLVDKITKKKKNGLQNEDIPEVLNSFVLSYLDHSGFADSYSALTEDLMIQESLFNNNDNKNPNSTTIEKSSLNPSIDLQNRDKIRKLITTNKIDQLISFLTSTYPNLFNLSTNDESIFQLKCLKLINMIKQATLNSNDTTTKKDNNNSDCILQLVEFGKLLKDQYNQDRQRVEQLNDISSLLLFEDPKGSKFGYLLKDFEIYKSFELLNKLILGERKLGESFDNDDDDDNNIEVCSIFERIVDQIEVVLKELVLRNDPEAMLINLELDFL